ncbi:MAG TPA: T9SS type A sorting domain-containing protein, partial [Saprospiraceae bacterium]|nr:T9SS type A sorting domain-containing protein [Saprospiraceae bacterium]
NLKSIELKNSDQSYSHRYGWTYVKSKAPNIHLFSQSVVGRDGEGPVLVTMFDTSLALRTWRNYTASIRVESANIDGNFFLFGGQVPVESGGEGFALMKVNSSNAIVEQFKNFKKELNNSSIASSSASLYDRSLDKIWTIIKPNGTSENVAVLLENQAVIDHECSENLSSTVAKDPIGIADIDMDATPLELSLIKIDCNSSEIKLLNKEICTSSGTEINSKINLYIFPNPFSDHLTVESDQMIEHIEILSADGRPHKSLFQKANKINLDLQLFQGIYFLKIYFINGNSHLEKVLCYY